MALINYITQVQFDFGAVKLARAECERVGITRPLICTDKGVVAAGLLGRLRDALGDLPVAVFDGTPSNPTESAVMAAVAAYREHRADGLIALGGGSPIDLAKGVAIMATHPGHLTDYATIHGGSPKITPAVAPLIAIPTTAASWVSTRGRWCRRCRSAIRSSPTGCPRSSPRPPVWTRSPTASRPSCRRR